MRWFTSKNKKLQAQVAYEEATSLWHDYAIALCDVENIEFTERCTRLSHRIIVMAKAFGPVHWRDIPLNILVTHYEATYGRGNIGFPKVDWNQVNIVARAVQDLRTPVFVPKPTTVADYELITAARDSDQDYADMMNTISLEYHNDVDDATRHLGTTGRHHIA